MNRSGGTLGLWQHLASKPLGKWLFGRILCFKAPYFGSIHPRFLTLQPGCCAVSIKKRRAVLNHLGTVHAIAMCNMAELAAGVMTEVTIPPTHRWIPKGMTVEYIKKAGSDVVATAKLAVDSPDWSKGGDHDVDVVIRDRDGEDVFKASITMRVSPKK